MAAINVTDLSNAKLDVDHIADVANSTLPTATDRLGNIKDTVKGAVDTIKAFNSRGAWVTATAYAVKDLVTNGGQWYACVTAHTSSASFATDSANWRVHQGITAAELLAFNGATKVNYQPSFPGATPKNVQTKAIETVSILEAGGADDWNGTAGTNNFAAFETLCALAPIDIILPFTNTGVYMVDGATVLTDLEGVRLVPAPGVSVYIKTGSGAIALNKEGVSSTRALSVYREDDRYDHPIGAQAFINPSEKTSFMDAKAGELHIPIALDFTTEAYSVQISAWPNGVISRYTPTVTAADSVEHPATPGTFAATLTNVVPGDQISAHLFTVSATYLPGIMLQTDTGWFVAWAPPGNTSIATMELIGGVGVNEATQQPVLANPSYNPDKSTIGVVIYDEKNFGFMVGGVVIHRYKTDGAILAAGFAVGFSNAATYISNPVMFRGKRTVGLKPLKIVGIGDSISDRKTTLVSQYEYMAQHLAGMGGCQVETLTNLAVSGNTSAQQLTALLATTVTGYDYGLIQIGVNDIQTAAGAATLADNVEDMVTYLRTNGVTPIVGVPTMWYSQTSAQAFGQDGAATNDANATLGAQYRQILMRRMATLGVHVNTMAVEDQGAVVASLLALQGGSPGPFDNIHPGPFFTSLLGYSWAKSIAAHVGNTIQGRDNIVTKMDVEWFAGAAGTTSTPKYTVDGRTLCMTWFLSRNSETWANGATIGTLPSRLRPSIDTNMLSFGGDASTIPVAGAPRVIVGADGLIKVYDIPAATVFLNITGTWRI